MPSHTKPSHLLRKSILLLNFFPATTLIYLHLFYKNKDQGLHASWTNRNLRGWCLAPRGLFSCYTANRWNKFVSLESESIWIHSGRKHCEKTINMRVSISLPCLALSVPIISSTQFPACLCSFSSPLFVSTMVTAHCWGHCAYDSTSTFSAKTSEIFTTAVGIRCQQTCVVWRLLIIPYKCAPRDPLHMSSN